MSELMIAIHEAVAPFNQVFYACCLTSAAALMLFTIKIKLEG